MIKVGITGQNGFIGINLFNYLGTQGDIERIPFGDEFFNNQEKLKKFVQSCDSIVHLAALNRHNDPQVIYDTNIDLVKKLIDACEVTQSKPHIIFSSSIQEKMENAYGKSKKDGRKLLEQWAEKNNNRFSAFVIPNVFGPFGLPYHNSVVATFCYQLTHNEEPKIHKDSSLQLIYVGELVKEFYRVIIANQKDKKQNNSVDHISINHSVEIKVSELLTKLKEMRNDYFYNGIFPNLNNIFDRNLFNSFVSYIKHDSFFPFHLNMNTDNRGSFVETVKEKNGGQISFSTTKPGITRGNHFHTRKVERFAVIKGKAKIELRRIGTNKKLCFHLDGNYPAFVDMPIWYTHNITNQGDEDLYTIFWINEFFDPNDPDTFYEEV